MGLYSVLTGKYPRIKKEQYTRNKKLSDACNDLLDSMLQHNPVMRPRIQELVNNPWFPAESSPSGLSLSLPIKVNDDVCESPRRGKSPRQKHQERAIVRPQERVEELLKHYLIR